MVAVVSGPGFSRVESPKVTCFKPRNAEHLYLFDMGMIFAGARHVGARTARYNAAILLTCDRAPFQIRTAHGCGTYQAVAIKPGTDGVVSGQGEFVCVRLNPMHPEFRRFSAIREQGVVPLERESLAAFDVQLEAARSGQLTARQGSNILAGFVESAARQLPRGRRVDARINSVLRLLRANPNCTLGELSTEYGVSRSRMSHVFRASVGLSIQTYLRWQRFHRATKLMSSGRSLTDIAHLVGYSDLSHFGREFRELAGTSASSTFRSGRVGVFSWYEADARSTDSREMHASPLQGGEPILVEESSRYGSAGRYHSLPSVVEIR